MITISGVLYDGEERVRDAIGIGAVARGTDSLGPPLDLIEPKANQGPQPPASPIPEQLESVVPSTNSKNTNPFAVPTSGESRADQGPQPPATPTPEQLRSALRSANSGGVSPPSPPTPEELAAFRSSQVVSSEAGDPEQDSPALPTASQPSTIPKKADLLEKKAETTNNIAKVSAKNLQLQQLKILTLSKFYKI